MPRKIGPEDFDIILKFGGGLHTRASEDEIDDREAAGGDNFLLDIENKELKNRPPFDLLGTVPNSEEIRGGATLRKADGTVSLLVQGGDTVYEWSGGSMFSSVGTVLATAKLRGHWSTANFELDDKVIITDLNLVEEVHEWDGTTFQETTFTDEDTNPFGDFYAKYCVVSSDRAIFFNVRDSGGTFGHLIVGSKRGEFENITVANRPSSALGDDDPWFLTTPDLKSVNGAVEAFGTTIISGESGRLFNLSGSTAKDFAFADFYAGSAAKGDEALAYIGNDIIYGRAGRIESVRDTDRFGDSEADDLTLKIADTVEAYTGWTIVFNSRLNRAYLFPAGQSEVWVVNTTQIGGQLSPWMRWKTDHALAFQPTAVMSMLDPSDGLEYIFMGDASGNFYRLEGTGANGDGGSADIETTFLSRLYSAPLDAQAFRIEGQVRYRKNEAATLTLKFRFTGETAFTESLDITIPEVTDAALYGGDFYYGGDVFYGSAFEGKLARQPFFAAGQSNEFQVECEVTGKTDFALNQIGIRFIAAS